MTAPSSTAGPDGGSIASVDLAGLGDPRAGATGREIAQQPAVWRQVAEDTVARRDAIGTFLRPLLAEDDLRIVLTGAGTSAFVGELLAPALTKQLRRRVEAVAPVESPALHERLRSLLSVYLDDNRQAWELGSDGVWERRVATGAPRASHEVLQRNSWGLMRDGSVAVEGAHPARAAGD